MANCLQTQKPPQFEEAIQYYTAATALGPRMVGAWVNLGNALAQFGKLPQAVAAYEKALELRPHTTLVHYNLGNARRLMGQFQQAVDSYREAVRLAPDFAEAHCNLGHVLQLVGLFNESLESFRRGHEIGAKRAGWKYPSALWIQETERLVALDEKHSVVDGLDAEPDNPPEQADFARYLCYRQRYLPAVQHYLAAFAAQPALAADFNAGHRFDAARAAAAASCLVSVADDERNRLRGQALDWLQQDLAQWRDLLTSDSAENRARAARTLTRWRHDQALACIRDSTELHSLPEKDSQEFNRFWKAVDALLLQLRSGV